MATLLISSKNYSSWSLRGFLLARLARLDFEEQVVASDDPNTRAELLLRASSIRVPCLVHDGVTVWDTLAIAEYLHEVSPKAGMYPGDRMARARCRSISGEMHSGFSALRSSLPMNLRTEGRRIAIWSAAQADIDRITEIWRECLDTWKGPWLFGRTPTVADAMYAPGGRPLPQLRRAARSGLRGVLRACLGLAGPGRVGRRGAARAGADRGTGSRVLTARRVRRSSLHGVGAGTGHGPSTSSVLKSAGPTTSRYSMSGE